MSGEVDGLAGIGIAHQPAEIAPHPRPPDVPGIAVLDDRLPEALPAGPDGAPANAVKATSRNSKFLEV
ncbi:hypothetical protein AB0F15_29410, partial [Amycolatopsis sp. NPDC026612]